MRKYALLGSLAVVVMVSLAGCGGGSSSKGENPARLSGTAVDDLIFNGVVTAKKADGSPLASGRTNKKDGTYKLNVNYDGIVIMNVSCDGNSTMGPDSAQATPCANQGVSLNSLAAVKPGKAATVNVSPLTQIVYERAKVLATDTAHIKLEDLDQSRREVALMFNVTDPITDNPTTGNYAEIIKAVDSAAKKNGKSATEFTTELAQQLSDGSADSNEPAVMVLVKEMQSKGIKNHLADNNGTYTPPESTAVQNAIDEAKTLFDNLRTQTMSVVNYQHNGTPGFLDKEAQSMHKALHETVMDTEYISDVANTLVTDIVTLEKNNITTLSDYPFGPDREYKIEKESTPGTFSYTITEANGTKNWSGTVYVPIKLLGNNAVTQLYSSGTLKLMLNGKLPLDYLPVTKKSITDSQSFDSNITVTKTTEGANISLSGKLINNQISIEIQDTDAQIGYSKDANSSKPLFKYVKLNKLQLQGTVDKYTINGLIKVNSYAHNKTTASQSQKNNSGWLPDDITFNGSISETGASLKGELQAKWLNAKTIDLNSDEKPLVNVQLSADLKMPDRPKMQTVINFENNTTNNTIGASYSYNKTIISTNALFDSKMKNGTIEVKTPTGLRADLKVKNGHLVVDGSGKVTKNGSVLGSLQDRAGVPVIKYTDGSFESLP